MFLNLLKTLSNHERYQTISIFVSILILVWIYGCDTTCESLTTPGLKVTHAEMDIELDAIIKKAELRTADIEKQNQIKKLLFNQSVLASSGVSINPVAVLTSLGALLGIGAGIDNVRKRKEIKTLKNSSP